MNQGKRSDVFVVPIGQVYLLYSPLRQLSALVNRPAVEQLGRWVSSGIGSGNEDHIQQISREIQQNEPVPPARLTGRLKPAFLGIIPTRRCNGRCLYCDFGAGKAQPDRMDFRTVMAAVDWMAKTVIEEGRRTLELAHSPSDRLEDWHS